MIPPKDALGELCWGWLLGVLLGLCWGFLRPLGKVGNALRDSLFLLAAGAGLCHLAFGICGGDLRLPCLGAAVLGGVGEEAALGRLLRPVFYGFWSILAGIYRAVLTFWKKFFKTAKNVFASAGKWGTIGRKNCLEARHHPGGSTNDRVHHKNRKYKGGFQKQHHAFEDFDFDPSGVFHAGPGGP